MLCMALLEIAMLIYHRRHGGSGGKMHYFYKEEISEFIVEKTIFKMQFLTYLHWVTMEPES
jgi:hypothetical protein